MNLPATLPDEITETLVQAKHVSIERFVSEGHASAPDFWYDQTENEFVLLVQSAARLRFENGVVEMKSGDWIDIPAHKRHRVEWTTPDEKTVWLAVFSKTDPASLRSAGSHLHPSPRISKWLLDKTH